ncbi:MAG: tetratricopeptide repeat protein [Gemmatimonadota bacterium]
MSSTKPAAKQKAAAPVVAVEPPSREERFLNWFKANQTPVLAGAAVLATIVLLTWGFSVASARKEAAAQARLEAAWNAQDAGNLPLAASEFQAVVDGFGGTNAAMEAVIAVNQARLLNGQSQLAVDALREFLATNPPMGFKASAGRLLGAALENVGKPVEAAAAYEAAAADATEAFRKAEALLAAGRAYRAAGNTEAAIRVLRQVITDYPETASFPAAEIRLGELTKGS